MRDDHDEVRALLAGVPLPPMPVDVIQAMRAGRRSRLRRRGAASGVAAVAVAVLAVPVGAVALSTGMPGPASAADLSGNSAAASTTQTASPAAGSGGSAPAATVSGGAEPARACPVTALPTASGAVGATPVAVDPTGRYVVGTALSGQNYVSVLWTDGKPQVLAIPTDSAQATAVNQHGVVVGLANQGSHEYVFRYQNGTITLLSGPAGHQHLFPTPVLNAAGDIVINAEPVGVEATDMITLRWSAGSTQPQQLPLPAQANVFGLDDDGTMLGTLYDAGHATSASLWDPTGHGHALPSPPGYRVAAYHLRGDWALGLGFANATPTTAVPGTSQYRGSKPAILWNVRTARVQVLSVDTAPAVNAGGWTAITDSSGAAIIRDTQRRPLASLPGSTGSTPRAVSDTQLVVGVATLTHSSGPTAGTPVAWHC